MLLRGGFHAPRPRCIASAAIPELLAGGHQVVGLARSEASAAKVQALGAEDDIASAGPGVDGENHAIGLAQEGVRSSVIRLAPMVHSDLDAHGFTPALIGFARAHGAAAYVGDEPTAGPQPTHVTSVSSTASRWRRRPPARACTGSGTRASPSGRSRRRSPHS